jgi:hypothetical protein
MRMARPRYIKGKDGKFTGSIGSGKTNVPAAAPSLQDKIRALGAIGNEPVVPASTVEEFEARVQFLAPQVLENIADIDDFEWASAGLCSALMNMRFGQPRPVYRLSFHPQHQPGHFFGLTEATHAGRLWTLAKAVITKDAAASGGVRMSVLYANRHEPSELDVRGIAACAMLAQTLEQTKGLLAKRKKARAQRIFDTWVAHEATTFTAAHPG